MQRPQQDTQIPLRYRQTLPPQSIIANNESKRRRIDSIIVDQNNVDQALAVIISTLEYNNKEPTLILIELSYFKANYV
jgi:hypothetical protein